MDGRLAVRQRFKLATEFLGPVRNLVQRGFASRKKGNRAFCRAMSHVMLRAVVGDYPDQRIDPAKVLLSAGNLQNVVIRNIAREGASIHISYHDKVGMSGAWDDEVILCAYHPVSRVAGINTDKRLRLDKEMTLVLPAALTDEPVHLYIMAHDRYQRKWAASTYLGVH